MASLTFRVTGVCGGGNHFTLQISGDVTRTMTIERAEIEQADLDLDVLALMVLKLWARGRNATQIRNALQTGVTVAV